MRLTWHNYRSYPYERELACREAMGLFGDQVFHETLDGVELVGYNASSRAARLTYFAGVRIGGEAEETLQSRLENTSRSGKTRQSTRYSVHGLHEYKGKFNPQIAKAILNIFNVASGQRVLDPFCGSGTTLVECAHTGIVGYGVDINPLAVFLSNAKLQALVTPASKLRALLYRLSDSLKGVERQRTIISDDPRSRYLRAWFDPNILHTIEAVRISVEDIAREDASIFLTIASNLLRDYSLQDPKDLRIRRRRSRLPDVPFADAFLIACALHIDRIESAQALLNINAISSLAVLCDATTLAPGNLTDLFDASVTSPPYAKALPYIDTQRLSLVWLNLVAAERLRELESELIGSREIRGPSRDRMLSDMQENLEGLPNSEASFCCRLQESLDEHDGFRRQAVPILLYRYFSSMKQSFRAIRSVMRPRAPFALIVGHNHSVLGGVRYDINTPTHLANIALDVGWTVEELVPLQTYRRYGYHMSNAVNAETLILLRNL